ncbi:hypothetical protein [Nocardia sp. NPDC050710]|uniref:hypothetical protein n=1 Tax=Nocardia sp. NPDC050710 TaxID=3157220 RepID=UPI0033DDEBE5
MTGTAPSVRPAALRAAEPHRTPRAVSVAFGGLVVALVAGVAEAIAQATIALERPPTDLPALATGLLRGAIYLAVLLVAVRMTHGDRWARLTLTFGIGVLGLTSLIVEPLRALSNADDFGDLFTDVTMSDLTIAALRAIHVLAVLVAIPAMYTPTARRHFRTV